MKLLCSPVYTQQRQQVAVNFLFQSRDHGGKLRRGREAVQHFSDADAFI